MNNCAESSMEKINLRPLFKIVDALIQPLGWLSLKKAQHVNLMLACSTADIKRILRIHNRQHNGLTEEQKTDLFIKVSGDVAWFERFNADPEFRKDTSTTAKSQSGSDEDPHKIEEKFKSLYYNLCFHNLFPQTFEGQKLAVSSLNVYGSEKLKQDVYKASPFDFLLAQDFWHPQTLQWLAEDAVDSAQSYNRLKANPSSELVQTLVGYCPFQSHQIEPFLEKHFYNINWMQTERKRGASDISTLRPLWELAVKDLSEDFVIRLIEAFPVITQRIKFTKAFSERKNISTELFDAIMRQEKMSLKRLVRQSRDPDGILAAIKAAHVQSYCKEYNKQHAYTKNLLAYLAYRETQQTRNNIVEALATENLQPDEPVHPPLATRRKM